MLHIVHGIYRFRPRRIAFRNDYCLSCEAPCRSVQFRTFDALHLFWIPLIPLGFRKRWLCSTCGREPGVNRKTRRAFKWAGLAVLLIFGAAFWAMPADPEIFIFSWVVRVAAPLGAVLLLLHLLRTPPDLSRSQRLQSIPPANDTSCPFCGTALLLLSSQSSCPHCHILRL